MHSAIVGGAVKPVHDAAGRSAVRLHPQLSRSFRSAGPGARPEHYAAWKRRSDATARIAG